MRKALVVGIDYYEKISSLHGCANDAHSVKRVLAQHSDGSNNFFGDGVRLLTATGPGDMLTRGALKDSVNKLFKDAGEVALFYFAGHGHLESTGGYLCASDCRTGDDGLPLAEVLTFANQSKAQNKVVVLDSCHSGIAGTHPLHAQIAELSEGLTVLTASTAEQYATEENGRGVFTTLFVDALNGAAANLAGDITPGSVYAHIDQSLGPWEQRPVFKTNVKSFVSLRKVHPPISLEELRRIVEFFPSPGYQFKLDPTFERERAPGDEERGIPLPDSRNSEKFAVLQKYNRVNLLVPCDAPHMWHAAMWSKSCKLTVLGEHYRRLVARGRI